MTILSPQTLLNFLDLISDGVSVGEATVAIGAKSSTSKIAFKWIADSEAKWLADFEMPAAVSEPWCVVRDGTPQWFHIAYREAVIAGRNARSIHRTPIRAELEQRLRAKRAEQPKPQGYLPPRVMVGKPSDELPGPRMIVDHVTQAPVILDPPPPKPRPSYARKSPPLDASNVEPPQEGRFVMTADRPKSMAERRAGSVEITDIGVRRW